MEAVLDAEDRLPAPSGKLAAAATAPLWNELDAAVRDKLASVSIGDLLRHAAAACPAVKRARRCRAILDVPCEQWPAPAQPPAIHPATSDGSSASSDHRSRRCATTGNVTSSTNDVGAAMVAVHELARHAMQPAV